MGESLKQGVVFVKVCGVQGAPWQSSGCFWVSLECISHHTASSGCPWPPSSSTHDSAQCKSVWYLAFLSHITFFLLLSRGICLRAALQITSRTLLLLSPCSFSLLCAGPAAGTSLQRCKRGAIPGGWMYKQDVLYKEKLIVGWKWVETLWSWGKQPPSHLLHHLKQMKTGLMKFVVLFPAVSL